MFCAPQHGVHNIYVSGGVLPDPPSTPTNLAAVGATGSIALTCDTMSGATSYDWQYSTDGGSTYSALTSTASGSTTDASAIAHIQASSGKVYYKVRATNRGGSSSYASAVNASPYKAYTLFPQANSTDISGSALEVGGNWSVLDGSATVQGHKLVPATAGTDGDFEGVVDLSVTDTSGTAVCTITGASSQAAVILRESNLSNFWLVLVFLDDASISIYKRVAGTYTQMPGGATVPVVDGTPFTIGWSFSGNTLTATFNGANSINATDTFNNTATKVGFRLGVSPAQGSATSFKVTSP